MIPEEVAGFFRELRPYVSRCRFPDCTHTHEDDCAVKDAVADGWIDTRRYESYVQIRSGDDAAGAAARDKTMSSIGVYISPLRLHRLYPSRLQSGAFDPCSR